MQSFDLKDTIQNKAQELADAEFGDETEWYDLPLDTQVRLYSKAEVEVYDMLAAKAEAIYDLHRGLGA